MINFSDILGRNCPLWTIEMGFQTIKISKFFGLAFPHNPLMAHAFGACKIHQWLKNVPIILTQKVGQSVWVQDIIVRWRSVQMIHYPYRSDMNISSNLWNIRDFFWMPFFCVFFKQCILTRIIGVNSQWENPDCATFKSYSFLVLRKYS